MRHIFPLLPLETTENVLCEYLKKEEETVAIKTV